MTQTQNKQTNKQITQRGKEEMVDANIVLKNAIILLLIFRRNERITIFSKKGYPENI